MNTLSTALWITLLGMGLVFAAIILLWAMMTLLTSLTADKEPAEKDSVQVESPASDSDLAQAAALAVAIALAEQGLSSARPLSQPPTAIVSAWQLGMRTRQQSEKGNFRRR
jgi:Na+-transporting methylmalonyl-CoA/oxaloacetate decarboxylase gamma subunit